MCGEQARHEHRGLRTAQPLRLPRWPRQGVGEVCQCGLTCVKGTRPRREGIPRSWLPRAAVSGQGLLEAASDPGDPRAGRCIPCSPRPAKTGFMWGTLVWALWPKGRGARGPDSPGVASPRRVVAYGMNDKEVGAPSSQTLEDGGHRPQQERERARSSQVPVRVTAAFGLQPLSDKDWPTRPAGEQ